MKMTADKLMDPRVVRGTTKSRAEYSRDNAAKARYRLETFKIRENAGIHRELYETRTLIRFCEDMGWNKADTYFLAKETIKQLESVDCYRVQETPSGHRITW